MPFFNKDKFIRTACADKKINSYEHEIAVVNSLNKLTLRKFRKMLVSSAWELKIFRKRFFNEDETVTNLWVEKFFRAVLNRLPLLPVIEEFSTPSVLIILQKVKNESSGRTS